MTTFNNVQNRFGREVELLVNLNFQEFNATDSLAIVGLEGTSQKEKGSTCFVCSLGVIFMDLPCAQPPTDKSVTTPSDLKDLKQGNKIIPILIIVGTISAVMLLLLILACIICMRKKNADLT